MRGERLIGPAVVAALALGTYGIGRGEKQAVEGAQAVDNSKPKAAIEVAGELRSQQELEKLVEEIIQRRVLADGDGNGNGGKGNGGAEASPTPIPIIIVTPTPTPRPTEIPTGSVIERNGVRITGVPERIDSSRVDVARGQFRNILGLGTEGWLAEPGGLLVGPDFGSKSSKNPWGENPTGWDTMYDSGGSIKPFSSVSQEVLRYAGPAFQNLPEGGFILASAGQMTARVGNATFEFRQEPGKNYFFIVRGLYPDGKQDSDLNNTVEFTNYKPGHALVNMYESRFKTNTAFISEGQFLQMASTSHSSGTNCGAEGCSRLKVVFYDLNTQALTIIEQTQGRFKDPAANWQPIFRNW